MYDYRLPKNQSRSKSIRKSPVRKPSVRASATRAHKPRSSSHSKKTKTNTSIGSLLKAILYLLASGLVLIVGLSFLLRMVAPVIFPLERDEVVVFTVADQSLPSYALVTAFRPSANLVTMAEVPMTDTWPSASQAATAASWSQMLGIVVDRVIVDPDLQSPVYKNQKKPAIDQWLWHKITSFNDGPLPLLSQRELRLWLFNQTLSDSQRKWSANPSQKQWQSVKSGFVIGDQFRQCPVGVINTTSTSGLATAVSDLIENSGYPVVRLSDNTQDFESSIIFYDPESQECRLEAERMTRLFVVPPQLEANSELVKQYRAQVVIFLGKDAITRSAQ